MEREILYRGKRKDNGEWIESLTLFQLDENLYMLQTAWADITYDLQYNITAILGRKKPFLVEVIPSTVGQYTGLTDKNGVKIFEGDIVRLDNRSPEGSWTAVVEFGNPNGTYSWGYQLKRIYGDEGFNPDILLWIEMEETGATCEIIENIHDNPEMLKGET